MQRQTSLVLLMSATFFFGGATACLSASDVDKKAKTQAKTDTDTSAAHAEKIVKGEAPAATAEQKKQAADTAKAVNKVPGVNVSAQDLTPPQLPPITGFHPIKKALRPIEDMETMVVKLQQQIMRLEGPISSLNPPMVALHNKMTTVDGRINTMQGQLTKMSSEVTGVRSDLSKMQHTIGKLEEPITSLQGPIANVAHPLEGVQKTLEQVQKQLNWIIMAIIAAALAISIGTPVAAILIYVNRQRLFPQIKEKEMPKVTPGTPASSRR